MNWKLLAVKRLKTCSRVQKIITYLHLSKCFISFIFRWAKPCQCKGDHIIYTLWDSGILVTEVSKFFLRINLVTKPVKSISKVIEVQSIVVQFQIPKCKVRRSEDKNSCPRIDHQSFRHSLGPWEIGLSPYKKTLPYSTCEDQSSCYHWKKQILKALIF